MPHRPLFLSARPGAALTARAWRPLLAMVLMGMASWSAADAPAPKPPGSATSQAAAAKADKTHKGAAQWRTLSPASCQPLSSADQAKLPATWQAFATAARRCELAAPGTPAKVALVSIFTEEYYRGRPANAPWEEFPKPLLLDASGRCVGVLPELYPTEEPRTLTLRHGLWRDGVPQEIRVQVANPAVGGDYALPPLRWDAAQQRYRAAGAAGASGALTSDDSTCPQS